MKKLFIAMIAVMVMSLTVALPALAHNIGHVDVDAPAGCVNVGGGNDPPVGNGGPIDPAGVHHAAGEGNSRIEGGACAP